MVKQENLLFTVERIWNHVLLRSLHRINTCRSLTCFLYFMGQISEIDIFLES